MRHICRISIILSLLLSPFVFNGCDDDSSVDEGCPYGLPDLNAFYAKWVSQDSVQILWMPEQVSYYGGPSVWYVIGRLYTSSSPEGPWEHITTDSVDWSSDIPYFQTTLFMQEPERLHFFRLDLDFKCTNEIKSISGPIIATTRPALHPDEMEEGPIFTSSRAAQSGSRGGTVISEDGTKIFAGHREGRIFDLATGEDITPDNADGSMVYMKDAGIWEDSLLILCSSSFLVYNSNTRNKLLEVSGPFSFRNDDTSFVLLQSTSKKLFHFNTITRSLHLVNPSYAGKSAAYTTTSPSYKYIAGIGAYLGQVVYAIMSKDFTVQHRITPFGDTSPNHDLLIFGHIDFPGVPAWGEDDDLIFLWTSWSGSLELWTYSISGNEYKQITGYSLDAYPGEYVFSPYTNPPIPTNISTINFVYDQIHDRLILFFRIDAFSYNSRYIPVQLL